MILVPRLHSIRYVRFCPKIVFLSAFLLVNLYYSVSRKIVKIVLLKAKRWSGHEVNCDLSLE